MLTIRLQRIGKKHQPSYRLVVAPARSKMGAPPTEDLGSYDPRTKQANVKAERVQYWIGVGAAPSLTVHNLLVRTGVVNAPKKAIPMARPTSASPSPEASEEQGKAAAGEPVKKEDMPAAAPVSAEATADKEAEAPAAEAPAEEPAA